MTEYDLADLLGSASSDSLVFIPVMLTVVSGYLVVAWMVGAELAKSQVALVNSLFIGSSIVFALSWNVRIEVAPSYQNELLAMNTARERLVNPWLQPVALSMALIVISACLKFMWDIRHPKTNNRT